MKIKRAKGKTFGAEFTAAEKKAMEIEIRRQLAEYTHDNLNEIDALILWHLHEEFGFGKKRLMRFYETFAERVEELSKHYMFDTNEIPWMYTKKLKDYGIDIKKLNKEKE